MRGAVQGELLVEVACPVGGWPCKLTLGEQRATCAIGGPTGSGVRPMDGAAVSLVTLRHRVIVLTYSVHSSEETPMKLPAVQVDDTKAAIELRKA